MNALSVEQRAPSGARASQSIHSHIPRQLPHTNTHTQTLGAAHVLCSLSSPQRVCHLSPARRALSGSRCLLKAYTCVCECVSGCRSVRQSLCRVCVCVCAAAATKTCEYKNKLNNISSRYTLPDRHCMRYTTCGGSAAAAPTPPRCRQRRR